MNTFHKPEDYKLHSSKFPSLPQKMARRNRNFGWSLPISKMKRGLPFATPNGVKMFVHTGPRCNFTTKLCVCFLSTSPNFSKYLQLNVIFHRDCLAQAVCIQFFPTLTTSSVIICTYFLPLCSSAPHLYPQYPGANSYKYRKKAAFIPCP